MVDVSAGPPFPQLLGDLWKYFCEVSSGVAPNGMGPLTVTWEAIAAWSSLMLVTLEPWEAQAMIRLGQARAAIQDEKTEAEMRRAKASGAAR